MVDLNPADLFVRLFSNILDYLQQRSGDIDVTGHTAAQLKRE